MVYGTYNYSIHGVYKPSFHHWGGPHCMWYNHFHQPWVLTGHEVHRSGDVRWWRCPDRASLSSSRAREEFGGLWPNAQYHGARTECSLNGDIMGIDTRNVGSTNSWGYHGDYWECGIDKLTRCFGVPEHLTPKLWWIIVFPIQFKWQWISTIFRCFEISFATKIILCQKKMVSTSKDLKSKSAYGHVAYHQWFFRKIFGRSSAEVGKCRSIEILPAKACTKESKNWNLAQTHRNFAAGTDMKEGIRHRVVIQNASTAPWLWYVVILGDQKGSDLEVQLGDFDVYSCGYNHKLGNLFGRWARHIEIPSFFHTTTWLLL